MDSVAPTLRPGDRVTLAWYEPGEEHRPRGHVMSATADDIARLDGTDPDGLVLVHWDGGNWRRWEDSVDLRQDGS